MRFFRTKKRVSAAEISPEEILLDARNLPSFEAGHLDGRLNKPIEYRSFVVLVGLLVLCGGVILFRSFQLMLVHGDEYRELAQDNRLGRTLVFPERGIIYDRNGIPLAWNTPHIEEGKYEVFNNRSYASSTGFAHLLGYVQMPKRDQKGILYRNGIEGVAGIEKAYDTRLRGTPGTTIVETDARMEKTGEGVLEPAIAGLDVHTTIDARLQQTLFRSIQQLAEKIPFSGGAGVIMDVTTGEIVAMTSYPEYDPNALVVGNSDLIATYNSDTRTPYLNRAVSGQYTPGSIVKPYMALAGLKEGVIRPETTFVSTGSLRLENPYSIGQYSVFTDWRAHGAVDLRRALAVSSNVYFYHVGGGFGGQKGLGIARIEQYMRLFGFGLPTGISLAGEEVGNIPSPAWKEETFPNDPEWRIGDTYHTSIGQYGFQVTPIQVVRAVASIANGGLLLTPRIETAETPYGARPLDITEAHYSIVRAGMRDAVLGGTAAGLNVPYVAVAAKTGTAEIDETKEYVHSWVMGFFPYDKPKYAFTIVMEHGSRKNLMGATSVMRQVLDWMRDNTPEYVETP